MATRASISASRELASARLSGPLQRLSPCPGWRAPARSAAHGRALRRLCLGGEARHRAPVAHGVITPVWAPTGIALAALVLYGPRLWPAVALGAFVANATSGLDLLDAAFISVGNTLEAVVGSLLLLRVGFRPAIDRVRDVFSLIVYGALLSTTIAATNGVTVLWISGDLDRSLRLRMAPLVDRRRHGGPDRRAAHVRALDEAVAATRPARAARGARRPRRARRASAPRSSSAVAGAIRTSSFRS